MEQLKQITKELNNKSTVANYISKLFESRNVIHILHLNTQSYAAHKALDDYYTNIVDLIDGLVESYQGKYGIIKGYQSGTINEIINPIQYLEEIAKFTDNNRTIFKDSYLQNQIDTILELIYSTLYKLKNLK